MVKKPDLKKIILVGIAGGLMVSAQAVIAPSEKGKNLTSEDFGVRDSSEGNLGYHLMTEKELFLELTPQGVKIYQSLDDEGKALARYTASQHCNYTNACQGLNACATEQHECAGQGECKGQGKCAHSDKNVAVKLVAKKMAQKRADAAKK